MSAETLRRASERIRRDKDIEENLGRITGDDYATWLAVADLLDHHAKVPASISRSLLAVARAYLGESA